MDEGKPGPYSIEEIMEMKFPGLPQISPGQMLFKEYMEPLSISISEISNATNLPYESIQAIIDNKLIVTKEIDKKLCDFFGLTYGWWYRLQVQYDRIKAEQGVLNP